MDSAMPGIFQANPVIDKLQESWKKTSEYQEVLNKLDIGKAQCLTGLPVMPEAALASALFQDTGRSLLLVTETEEEARRLYENTFSFLGQKVMIFPQLELLPFEVYAQNLEVVSKRVKVLSALASGDLVMVVTSAGSLIRRLPSPGELGKYQLKLKPGDIQELRELSLTLSSLGYERVNLVELPGTFSMRGSLVDIFPPDDERPTRVEFFDDEIENLRYFDPGDQISRQRRESLSLFPAHELPISPEARKRASALLEKEFKRVSAGLKGEPKKNLHTYVGALLEKLDQGLWDSSLEQLTAYFYPQANTLLDYFSQGLVALHEPENIFRELKAQDESRNSRYFELLEAGRLLPGFYDNFLDTPSFISKAKEFRLIYFSQLPPRTELSLEGQYHFEARVLPSYNNNLKLLKEDCAFFRSQGYEVVFSASSALRLHMVEEIVKDLGFPGVRMLEAGFTQGFESGQIKVALISEEELLSKESKRLNRRRQAPGRKIDNFLDLQAGDYVVHLNQGIGKYIGVERLTVGDIQKDYLHIQYAGNDKLYLPVDQLDLIQKYIGDDAKQPKLYKLGGGEWQRLKSKVQKGVQDMAKELLALYATREAAQGFAFSPDTPWQQEFEDAFPYPETPDQLQSLEEIKKDMEGPRPMDRLLCGDVGYGKTEVAMRAAFKAICDQKQVAVLVPTTVLAQQHLRTFKERFRNYPVSIGSLSRFSSLQEQKKTIKDLKEGKLDLIIGTHRILSKDLGFKDLGLLIVDEEQRFGVAHKEKLKELKGNVDVLTLSATPIPRTLHMALAGIRDISIIATPPEDRHPVLTYVLEFQGQILRDVVRRELNRGGQVFFVHNRVFNIYQVADEISRVLPEAKVTVAHGQMSERELEGAMLEFVENQSNVLVCTTIIESGLDIPNVNTLIVNDADTFGLAQLYQLRGRVGRSERQAYAYFTYRQNRIISETAKKRLIAIRDFTELGAGFKIAMRDMEIRGAGNILGPQQHGHIASVGFDLYCRLLQEEMDQQAGKAPAISEPNTLLELDIDAYIPDSCIPDSYLKVEIYKRVSNVKEPAEIEALREELKDRYGNLPVPMENLLLLGQVKAYSRYLGVEAIVFKNDRFEIRLAQEHRLEGEDLVELLQTWRGKMNFQTKKKYLVNLYVQSVSKQSRIKILLEFMALATEIQKNNFANEK